MNSHQRELYSLLYTFRVSIIFICVCDSVCKFLQRKSKELTRLLEFIKLYKINKPYSPPPPSLFTKHMVHVHVGNNQHADLDSRYIVQVLIFRQVEDLRHRDLVIWLKWLISSHDVNFLVIFIVSNDACVWSFRCSYRPTSTLYM